MDNQRSANGRFELAVDDELPVVAVVGCGGLSSSSSGSWSQIPVSAISGGPRQGIHTPCNISDSSCPGVQRDAPTKNDISSN